METTANIAPHQDSFPVASDKPICSAIEKRNNTLPFLYFLVARQPFFMGLNAQQLQLLTESAYEMQFEPGQPIFLEGSPANRFYLILEGTVVLESKLKDGGMIAIQTLGAGDELGWSWLFRSSNLLLSARALEPTKTIFFYGTHLRRKCEQDHELGYQLMKRIAEEATQCVRAMQKCLRDCTSMDQKEARFQNVELDRDHK